MSRLACICVLNVPLSLPPLSKEWLQLSFSWLIPGFSRKQWDVLRTCIIIVAAGANNRATRSLRLSFPRDRGGERSFRSRLKNVFLSRGQRDVFLYIYIKRPDVSFSNTRFRKEASTVSSSLHHEISIPERGTCSHNAGA